MSAEMCGHGASYAIGDRGHRMCIVCGLPFQISPEAARKIRERLAPAPSAAEVEALGRLLGRLIESDGNTRYYDVAGSGRGVGREFAAAVFAAGYVSPARHAAEVQAARAYGWDDGHLTCRCFCHHYKDTPVLSARCEVCTNPYRADGEAKA